MFKLVFVVLFLASASALPTFLHGDTALENIDHIDQIDHIAIAATPVIAGYRTILQPETIRIHEPAVAKVGDLVQKVPTSVSHQSQTVVHKHADVVTPIVTPAVKTYTSHVVKAYTAPVVYAAEAPIVKILH